ncbi:MAG TPA: hypothetical protein PKY03_08465 [Moraxellaceae bacterium]|nr:hypothetical protein [Moraxellaceae bacterium]
MHKIQKPSELLCTLLAAAILLSGCGGGSETASTSGSGGSSTGSGTGGSSSGSGVGGSVEVIPALEPGLLTGTMSLVAGGIGGAAVVSGVLAESRFVQPNIIIGDGAGSFYVSDITAHIIRKITPSGKVFTLAGTANASGHKDGMGISALFNKPSGLALDTSGNLYVADPGNNAIRKITPAGVVSTVAGGMTLQGIANGDVSVGRFMYPQSVGVDAAGNVYVADTQNDCLRKITSGGIISTFSGACTGFGPAAEPIDGTSTTARFNDLGHILMKADGSMYVTDSHSIRHVSTNGAVTTIAGSPGQNGSADGVGSLARFMRPQGMALSGNTLVVADPGNQKIRQVNLLTHAVTTIAGTGYSGSANGAALSATFNNPTGVAFSGTDILIADYFNPRILKLAAGQVTTIGGSLTLKGAIDGTGTSARFDLLGGVVIGSDGALFVLDKNNQSIRKIIGTTTSTFLAAGGLSQPKAMVAGASGGFVVAETNRLLSISAAGNVTVLAGSSTAGNVDGSSSIARFKTITALAKGQDGKLYVTESGNCLLRVIDTNGDVTTLAGKPTTPSEINCKFADGTGPAGNFKNPTAVAVAPDGTVYAADMGQNGNGVIRKVVPGAGNINGTVSTVAGSLDESGNVDAIGTNARFGKINAMTYIQGKLIIADSTGAIRRYSPDTGNVEMLVGVRGETGERLGSTNVAPGVVLGIAGDTNSLVFTTANTVLRFTPSTP